MFPRSADSGATDGFVFETHSVGDGSNRFTGCIPSAQLGDKFGIQYSAGMVLATVAPFALDLVGDVVSVSTDLEVRRINATRIVAVVPNDGTVRYRPIGNGPRGTVADPCGFAEFESPIALLVEKACPFPAVARAALVCRERETFSEGKPVGTFGPDRLVYGLAASVPFVMRFAESPVQHGSIANR